MSNGLRDGSADSSGSADVSQSERRPLDDREAASAQAKDFNARHAEALASRLLEIEAAWQSLRERQRRSAQTHGEAAADAQTLIEQLRRSGM